MLTVFRDTAHTSQYAQCKSHHIHTHRNSLTPSLKENIFMVILTSPATIKCAQVTM